MNETKHDQTMADEFDRWTENQRAHRMASGHAELVEWILNRWMQEFSDNTKVLDIGCGIGESLAQCKKKGIQQLFGIDVSPKMIEQAQAHFPEGSFKVASASSLPFDSNSFDFVLSIESLYYHEDPKISLQEALRVLKPGGWFGSAIELFLENPVGTIWQKALSVPVHCWSETQWQALLDSVGFENPKAVRIPRTPKPKSEFTPSVHFPSYQLYLDYTQAGALYLEGKKKK